MPNIILADDHELIREAVKPYLLQLADNVTIWEAGTYGEVLDLAGRAAEAPECVPLVLLDLHMPGKPPGDTFAGLRQVCQAFRTAAVVIFSGSEDGATIAATLRNGARGFVPKSARGRSLVNALKMVMEGEIYVPPSMIAEVSAAQPFISSGDAGETQTSNFPSSALSPRESESLRLLTQGMTNKEIAGKLGLKDVTVKMHLRNAYRKIGATNRIEAVRIAIEQRIP